MPLESIRVLYCRFVVTGRVTSGKLKTPADADSESLQAKWVADLGELSMRATDVLRLIELGREYRDRAPGERWHLPQVCKPRTEKLNTGVG